MITAHSAGEVRGKIGEEWNVVVGVSSSEPMKQPPLVGGSSLDLVQWVDIHGDRFCPQDLGLWDPFQMAL